MATWEYAPHVNMRGFLYTKSTCSQKFNTLRRDRKLKAIYEYVRVHPFFQGVNFMELSSMDYLDLCHKYINILMYFQDKDILLFLGMGEENYGPTRGNSRNTDGKDGNTGETYLVA